MEVQQQVRAVKDCFRIVLPSAEVLPGRSPGASRAAAEVEDDSAAQPESFHPLEERSESDFIRLGVACAAEIFQPVNLTAQLAQTLHVLQIDPAVPAPFGEVHDVKRRNDHARHKQYYLAALTSSLASS